MSIIFDGRFSNGGDFSGYPLLEVNGLNNPGIYNPTGIPGALSLVPDPEGSGTKVSKHFLDHNNPSIKRCEINSPSDAIGTTRWYYNRIYLSDWIIDPIGISEIINQIHDRPDDADPEREPPFSIRVEKDKFKIFRAHENAGNSSLVVVDWEGPIEINRWVEWVYKINWQYNGSGSLHVWKDSRPIVSMSGVSTCYNDALPLYAKVGPYKYFHLESTLKTRTTYNSGTAIGESYSGYNEFMEALGNQLIEKERLMCAGVAVCFS